MKSRNSRQSFLGENFLKSMDEVRVGIIGLGGGGSIVISNLAHVGFKKFFICDPDTFEESNINRLLGSRFQDINDKTKKVEIAVRTIKSVVPDSDISSHESLWQDCTNMSELLDCKIIFSCLDDFSNRMQLEAFARRNKIILIDIGLTIKADSKGKFHSMGQVVMSHYDGPCFKCLDFITERDLENEASRYGDVGVRPQVIWANSILASIAVGLGIEILSDWAGKAPQVFYKHLDGNKLEVSNNFKVESGMFENLKCKHY